VEGLLHLLALLVDPLGVGDGVETADLRDRPEVLGEALDLGEGVLALDLAGDLGTVVRSER